MYKTLRHGQCRPGVERPHGRTYTVNVTMIEGLMFTSSSRGARSRVELNARFSSGFGGELIEFRSKMKPVGGRYHHQRQCPCLHLCNAGWRFYQYGVDSRKCRKLDFSRAIRPNKLAALRGDFKQAVFLDKELWQHFGSEERVIEALRMLVSLAERSSRSVA